MQLAGLWLGDNYSVGSSGLEGGNPCYMTAKLLAMLPPIESLV